jgi:cytochrome P450
VAPARRYGDVFTIRLGAEPTLVLLADPEHVREVFTGDPGVLHAGEGNRILLPFVGPRSVLLLDDAEHLRQRKLLLPPFHGERMRAYAETIRDVAEREVASWEPGERIRLAPRMQAVTLQVIMRAVFGVRDSARLQKLGAVLTHVLDSTTRAPVLAMVATLGPDRVHRRGILRRTLAPVRELLLEEIRRARADDDAGSREDILALLVRARDEDGSPLTDDELLDELVTLLVAGHETTATGLAWAMERLVRHPAADDALRADTTGEYARAVAHETLRLRPVIPIVARRLTRPYRVAGHDLPAGTAVAPCIWLVHRRADVYPDPHAFRPERFLDQRPGTYTWIPFGGGIRRCLGANFALFEMTEVLRAIARGPRLRPAGDGFEPVRRRAVTLTPARRTDVAVAA